MPRDPEKVIRVSEITRDRVSYLAGSLAMNQGAVIELVIDKGFQDAKVELDALAQAFLDGDYEKILEARAAALAKLKVDGYSQAEDLEQQPILGTALLEDFQVFEATNPKYNSGRKKLGTRTFLAIARYASSADRPDSESYSPDFKGLYNSREMNLDQLARLVEYKKISLVHSFGKKSEEFVSDFLEFRKSQVAQGSDNS